MNVRVQKVLERPLPLLLLLSLSFGSLVGCPGETGGGDGGVEDTFTIGEPINEGACEEHEDCPVGFECRSGGCRQIDNDIDNDGYDATVDCDDNNAAIHPGSAEVCDEIDNNCSGAVDEGVRNACGGCGAVPIEICDVVDNDCDGLVDEECTAGETVEVEPNDGNVNCQPIALPPSEGETVALTGTFNPPGDKDSFCFFVRPGTQLLIDLDSHLLGVDSDGVLQLFGADSVQLPGGYNDYNLGPDPLLDFTFQVEQTVRLDVYNFDADSGGPEYIYDLKITALSLVECLDQDSDGVSVCDGDCRDEDPLVFPNQTEVCDDFDNNCDGVVDEACPDHTRIEAEPNNTISACEILMPPFSVRGVINPGKDDDTFCFFAPQGMRLGFDIDAREDTPSLLNSKLTLFELPQQQLANNFDGQDPETSYFAEDSDSYLEHTFVKPGIYAVRVEDELTNAGGTRLTYVLFGNVLIAPDCTDGDSDGVSTCEGDCDDGDPTVHFGAIEVCDGKDNTCDAVGDPPECTGDFDGDGYAGSDGDCNDADPTIHPGAIEACDGIDNNCSGGIDEGVLNACGLCGFAPPEQCGDDVDNDCDGETDEADCSADGDNDGKSPDEGDCNDDDDQVFPNATEVCNGIDDDCDGLVDEYVKNSCGVCGPDPEEICDALDNNCNGVIDDGVLNDCGYCGPAPVEVCDGLDNNCDGVADEGLLNACGLCGDLPTEVCDGLDNDCDSDTDEGCDDDVDNDDVTPREGDCNDNNDTVYWGANESCGDGLDNDCDGFVDEAPCAVPTETEPNGMLSQCNQMRWPGRIDGVVTALSDVDIYCFAVTEPDTELGFDIDARSLGSSLDSFLRVLGPTGALLESNNNGVDPQGGGSPEDSYVEYKFTTPGTYAVQVSAQSISQVIGGAAFYELHTLPVSGCLDLDGDGLTTCAGDCDDYNASTNLGAVDVCDSVDNNCVDGPDERCVGDCLDDELYGNTSFANAASVSAGAYSGLAYCPGQFDYFRISLGLVEDLSVQINFSNAEVNLSLHLYDADGVELQASTTANNNEVVGIVNASAGDYYLRVSGPLTGAGGYEMVVTVTP